MLYFQKHKIKEQIIWYTGGDFRTDVESNYVCHNTEEVIIHTAIMMFFRANKRENYKIKSL